MPYLYVLGNKFNNYYTGITTLDPQKRLARHNRGEVYSTRFKKPWTLLYVREFLVLKDARLMEKKIKSWKGGNAFKKFLSRTAGSSNGRTSRSGRDNLGSNPSPAVLERNGHTFGGVK